jgi:beta-galactosidase
MIELDGTLTERSKEAGRTAQVIAQNASLFLKGRPRAAEVGIVYNPPSYLTGGNTVGPGRNVRDSLMGIYRAFYERNIPAEYVHTDQLGAADAGTALARYKAIILPYPLMLTSAAARGLREYVSAGGTLVSEARPAWNDERGFANDRIPGGGLDEVFAAREAVLRSPESTEITLAPAARIPGMAAGDKFKGFGFEEHLQPASSAEVLAHFSGGEPAITSARFGKGRAILIGSFVGLGIEKEPGSGAARLLVGLAEQAGAKAPIELTGTAAGARVEARLMEGGGYRLLFLLNHDLQPRTGRVALAQAGARTGRDLFDGSTRSLPLDFQLPPRGTMVLEIR